MSIMQNTSAQTNWGDSNIYSRLQLLRNS